MPPPFFELPIFTYLIAAAYLNFNQRKFANNASLS